MKIEITTKYDVGDEVIFINPYSECPFGRSVITEIVCRVGSDCKVRCSYSMRDGTFVKENCLYSSIDDVVEAIGKITE